MELRPSVCTGKKCLAGGWFKTSWKLPDGIIASSKSDQYAHCKLCKSDFIVLTKNNQNSN